MENTQLFQYGIPKVWHYPFKMVKFILLGVKKIEKTVTKQTCKITGIIAHSGGGGKNTNNSFFHLLMLSVCSKLYFLTFLLSPCLLPVGPWPPLSHAIALSIDKIFTWPLRTILGTHGPQLRNAAHAALHRLNKNVRSKEGKFFLEPKVSQDCFGPC